MVWLTNVIIKNKEIKNERLEITDKSSLYYLGPDLTVRDCTIILKISAKNLLITGARFIDCTFEIRQTLNNHQDWVFASLKGCRFKGRLSGCDFGRWPGYSEGWESGAIEDCDFSQAELDGCRFMSCDASTLRFPPWPCFTILDPLRRAPELRSLEWPGLLGDVVIGMLHKNPPCTAALTYHAPSVAARLETTPEAIKAVLDRCEGILY